jgi:hypothetical protein
MVLPLRLRLAGRLALIQCNHTYFAAGGRGLIFQLPVEKLNSSRAPVKPDGHLSGLDNHRNFTGTLGMLQHGVELIGFGDDVDIFNLLAILGICFTSCPCVGSGILAENQYFFRHDPLLRTFRINSIILY